MTEKEKAKAYDKAIEIAKKWHNAPNIDKMPTYGNRIIEEIFPELKEEDAERIRKNCIHFLELQKQHHAATFEIEECIDWLEKQDFALENHQFISVTDGLPEQDEEVVVLCDEFNTAPVYKISFGHIVDKTIYKDYNGWNIPSVVYWFPMPKLPKE